MGDDLCQRYAFEGARCGTCRLPRTTPVTGCDEHEELARMAAILLSNAAALEDQEAGC